MELDVHKKQKALVIWYVDRWMPIVAGQKCFGEKMRETHFPAEKVEIFGKEKKVLVPISSEAFGILTIDNCHAKWVATGEWRKPNPKQALVKTGDNAQQFKAKYTDSNVGQVKFGGWHADAFTKFQEYIDAVQKGREVDEGNDWRHQKYALELVRKERKVAEKEAEASANPSKKKKKAPAPPAQRVLKRLRE